MCFKTHIHNCVRQIVRFTPLINLGIIPRINTEIYTALIFHPLPTSKTDNAHKGSKLPKMKHCVGNTTVKTSVNLALFSLFRYGTIHFPDYRAPLAYAALTIVQRTLNK